MLTFETIQAAAATLKGVVRVTPLLESELLNNRLGFRLLVKPECLQVTGSFKIRGAYTKIASLSAEERQCGVVAFSSGNHAQGVAAAASAMGVKATIIMPEDAPATKLRNTAALGAEVITYNRHTGDRAKIARDLAEQTGAVLAPPYDDYAVMAGQGTVGLEIADQLDAAGLGADAVYCPVGGGGLIAGLATALETRLPKTAIYAAEPVNFEDTQRSLQAGKRVGNETGHASICDSIVTQIPGELTFPINRRLLSGGRAVTEAEVLAAIRILMDDLKIVAEPGGAVAVAAAVQDAPALAGKTVVAVVSGGNADLGWLTRTPGQTGKGASGV
ncbi:threonine ammonia-lyase [Ponticoccus litoralis]|uniref:Threonine/serine dehydratase n=1 Tax=Ponticoccus litoralis TaxID=422297 RepID=A0AAW9SG82_9RHOB